MKNSKLQRLIDRLRAAPQGEAEVLLRRIQDGTALLDDEDSSALDMEAEESVATEMETSSSINGFSQEAKGSTDQVESTPSAQIETTSVQPLIEEATDIRALTMGRGFTKIAVSEDVYNTLVPLKSLERKSPADATLRAHLTDILGCTAMPNAVITRICVAEFFRCSGKIFQVFSPAQAYDALESIFSSSSAVKDKMQMCLVSIVAAIGSFYMAGTDVFYSQVGELYYRIAKTFLEDVVAKESRESVKVCALLSLYNILRQNISCLAFLELATALAKQQGLHAMHKPLATDLELWLDARRVWRLVVFLQSWAPVTFDYISAPWSTEDISSLGIAEETNLEGIAQCELAKIALLKARIIYKLRLFPELTLAGVNCMMADLRDWYAKLPTEMKLEYVDSEPTLFPRVQTVVRYVQLMHLNTITLINRAVTTQRSRVRSAEEGYYLGMSADETAVLLDEGIGKSCTTLLCSSATKVRPHAQYLTRLNYIHNRRRHIQRRHPRSNIHAGRRF